MVSPGRVLLIDNDPNFLLVYKELLETEGYTVFSAASPEQALKILAMNWVHLVLTDMRITDDSDAQDDSGLSLLRQIDPVIPKIIMTAYPAYGFAREALRPAPEADRPLAIDFLSKVEGPDALFSAVEQAFTKYIRINLSLEVHFAAGLTIGELVDILCPQSSREALDEELIAVFQRLFYEVDSIKLSQPFLQPDNTILIKIATEPAEVLGHSLLIVRLSGRAKPDSAKVRQERPMRIGSINLEPIHYVSTQSYSGALLAPVGAAPDDEVKLKAWYCIGYAWHNACSRTGSRRLSAHFLEAASEIATQLARILGAKLLPAEEKHHRLYVRLLDTSSVFQYLHLPDFLPLIFLQKPHIQSQDIENTLRLLGTRMKGQYRIVVLVAFLRDQSLIEAQRMVSERLGAPHAYDVVVLGRGDFLRITTDKEPSRALLRTILAHIDLATVSPFVVNAPVPASMFFGREHELRQVMEHAAEASFSVIGGRRVGKTSVLLRLHCVRLPSAGFHTVYHDCSTTPTPNIFLATTVRDWQPEAPSEVPNTFGDLLQSPPIDKLLVLLLDEADKLVSADRANEWPLFKTLRALANSGRVQIVLSGERSLRDALRDPTSPLFNFANEILLGPLGFHAVEELVTRPMKQLEIELVEEKAIVDRIWAFTSGHPNVVQRLCRRLIEWLKEQRTRRITLDAVDTVIEDPSFQRDDFLSTCWEAATSLEKIISLLMADDENVRTMRTVRQALTKRCNLHPKAREVDDALQRLVDLRSILNRTPTGYEFAVKAFPRVVAGTMTLDDMLIILTEEYQELDE